MTAPVTRPPHINDFTVDVEGVGSFTFGKRKLADEVKCQVVYATLTEGVQPTPWLHGVCTWIAELKTMTVRAPEGWDIDEMDPLDDSTYANLMKVHMALVNKESSFRPRPAQKSEGAGAPAG